MSLRLSILLTLVSMAAWGCGDGAKNPPDGFIQVFHAAPGRGAIRFLRIERSEAELNYKEGSAVLRVDTDTYQFNVDSVTRDGADRVLSLTRTIEVDTEYSFIVYEDMGAVDVLEFDKPASDLAGSSDSEVQLFHLAAGVGAVDVYLETPGTGPLGATPLGSAAFTQRIAPQLRAAGEYQLTFTAVNDPGTVLFTSTAFTLGEASNVSFSVVEGAGGGTAPLSVVVSTANGVADELFDEAQQPALRAFHGARTAGPLDLVVDGQFGAPLLTGVAFGELTGYETVPAGEFQLVVTPTDNPGTLEVDRPVEVAAGSEFTLLVLGEPGALTTVGVVDDNRAIPAVARFRVINQATQLGTVDLYIVAPGTDVATVSPIVFGFSVGATTGYSEYAEGAYDLVLTDFGGAVPIFGPQSIQLSNGGIYGAIVLDGINTGSAEVFLIDDFPP
jgi:hypothetical protein